MKIRPVTTEDGNEWLRMRLMLWPDAAEDHRAEIEDYFQRADERMTFVAEESGRLIGFLEASIRHYAEDCAGSEVGYIEGWWVDSEWRLKGVGGALVREAENWARSRGCREMASDCHLDNRVSLVAHLKLGYEETSRLIHFKKNL